MGTNTITIDGAERLRGIEHTLWSDHMEVGSFVGLAAMTHGEITIRQCAPGHLRMIGQVFRKLGVETEVRGDDLFVPAQERYVIQPDLGGAIPEIKPQIWPGFPSDLTTIATAVATQCEGIVLIHEWMFDRRMFWIDSLSGMGANVVLCDPHRAVVVGPSQLHGTELRSPDIRAGLALLAATLAAKGTSVISNIEQIDRGYEDLDGRLRALGAKIERAA
jgi:UDP-N-acetylglucosamine 1-carboxyvinyltransferase